MPSPEASSEIALWGMSAAVSTARTPGTSLAAEVSMLAIRAQGTRARTTTPCSMPGNPQSSA